MDLDLVPSGQRDHSADDGLARRALRAETAAADGGHRLHSSILSLRAGAVIGIPDHFPHHSGSMRRRIAAAITGRTAGIISGRKTRASDGFLGARDRGRSYARPRYWRLANR